MVELDVFPEIDPQPRDGFRYLMRSIASDEPEVQDEFKDGKRIGIIRTSDRIQFKGCRRRWGWSSHLRHNLGPLTNASPLWFGTGIHFALEDFHGYNRFGHPREAFLAFTVASKKHRPDRLPHDTDRLIELGIGMMDYYVIWLQQRKYSLFKTLWIDGIPQVEVNARIRLPISRDILEQYGYDEVYYSLTIDRVVIDDLGLIWPIDYKTASKMSVLHFQTDPQISSYMWAIPYLYDPEKYPIGGFKYMQFLKAVPEGGRLVYNGSKVSTAEDQATTYFLYRQTLEDKYGSVEASPEPNQTFLRKLAVYEDENKDKFIQVDNIPRNINQGASEGAKIMMESEDMLNPELPLYPNPTRFCAWWDNPCPFLEPCISLDAGEDWEHVLLQTTEPREETYDGWRKFISWPGGHHEATDHDRKWLDV